MEILKNPNFDFLGRTRLWVAISLALILGGMGYIAKNGLRAAYLRPIIYRGYENLGVNPIGNPVDIAVAAYPWGMYLGPDSQEKGVAVCISSWRRAAPDTFPSMAKAGGHYMNSQLMKTEAITNGYTEAIALDAHGWISEGSGENLFVAWKGELYTSPLAASTTAPRSASSRPSRAVATMPARSSARPAAAAHSTRACKS